MAEEYKITTDDIESCWKNDHVMSYFAELLNGDYQASTLREDLLSLIGSKYDPRTLKDGEPCRHVGCLNHRSHPCEGCGRVGGIYKREE